MTRYNNPYAGLSDGIQQGLRSMAQADVAKSEHGVRMAQMQLDKQQRDEDYKLRLANHELAKEQNSRQGEIHNLAVREDGKKEAASYYAEIQDAHGSIRKDLQPNEVEYFVNQSNDLYTNHPWGKAAMGELVKSRSNGKYDAGRLVPVEGGFAIEMYDSKNPEKRGVVTDRGSMDDDDPVSVFSLDQMIDTADTLKFLQGNAHSPAAAAALLSEYTGFGNAQRIIENNPDSIPPELIQAAGAGADGGPNGSTPQQPYTNKLGEIPAESIKPIQNQPEALATALANSTADMASNQSLKDKFLAYKDPNNSTLQTLGAGAQFYSSIPTAITDGLKVAASNEIDRIKGGFTAIGDSLSSGWNKHEEGKTPTPAPAQESAPQAPPAGSNDELRAAFQSATEGRAPLPSPNQTKADGTKMGFDEYLQQGLKYVDKAAKVNEAERRALISMGASIDRRSNAMGKHLLVETAAGRMTSAQAIAIQREGISDANDMMRLALSQPSSADIYMNWGMSAAARVGQKKSDGTEITKKDIDDAYDYINKTSNEMIKNINATRGGEKQGPELDPSVIGSARDVAAMFGKYDPLEAAQFIRDHYANIQEAYGYTADNLANYQGRDLRAVGMYNIMAKIRQGAFVPPVSFDAESKAKYEQAGLNIAAAFADDPMPHLKTEIAMTLYRNRVDKPEQGDAEVPVEEVIKLVKDHFKK